MMKGSGYLMFAQHHMRETGGGIFYHICFYFDDGFFGLKSISLYLRFVDLIKIKILSKDSTTRAVID